MQPSPTYRYILEKTNKNLQIKIVLLTHQQAYRVNLKGSNLCKLAASSHNKMQLTSISLFAKEGLTTSDNRHYLLWHSTASHIMVILAHSILPASPSSNFYLQHRRRSSIWGSSLWLLVCKHITGCRRDYSLSLYSFFCVKCTLFSSGGSTRNTITPGLGCNQQGYMKNVKCRDWFKSMKIKNK